MNQYQERDFDARMERTRNRPLPSRSIAPSQAMAFSLVLVLAGLALLAYAGGTKATFLCRLLRQRRDAHPTRPSPWRRHEVPGAGPPRLPPTRRSRRRDTHLHDPAVPNRAPHRAHPVTGGYQPPRSRHRLLTQPAYTRPAGPYPPRNEHHRRKTTHETRTQIRVGSTPTTLSSPPDTTSPTHTQALGPRLSSLSQVRRRT